MGSHRISKAKRNLMGVCMIKIEYPQNNLNEFCSGLVGNDHVAIFTMDLRPSLRICRPYRTECNRKCKERLRAYEKALNT